MTKDGLGAHGEGEVGAVGIEVVVIAITIAEQGASGTGEGEDEYGGGASGFFGGEEKGLRQRTRELCDGLVGLPMRGRVESLNVSTAAAALLYEAGRQRTVVAGAPAKTPGRRPGGKSPHARSDDD